MATVPAHRIVESTLQLRDEQGRPLANVPVAVRQTRHRFLFGCNAFLLDPAGASDEQRAYQERFAELLNYATLPFYWGAYEREPGQPQEARLRAMARWCRERGIATKGHPLCWHMVPPPWHAERPPEEMHRLQMGRIRREVEAFRGLIDRWDVVNEAVVMPRFALHPNHMTPLVQQRGVVPIVAEAFARARQTSADAVLLLNDFDHTEAYAQLIEQCLDAGVPIDAIGIQSHMHQGYLGAERVRSVCDRFARFGKPLHWTEATLISGAIRADNDFHTRRDDWPTTPEGEARQAEEVVSFYSTLYAHPAVEAVTWWDFRDDCWLGAPAGLLRRDMSPKPAYERLLELVRGAWWYGERELQTDAEGAVRLSGPRGDYELAVAGKRVVVEHDEPGTRSVTLCDGE